MRSRLIRTACAAVVATAIVGCDPRGERGSEPVAELPPVAAERPVEPLPEGVLAQLEAQVPRLGATPLPEPRPSPNADPERVPERVRETLPRRVLERVTGPATFYADKFEGRRTASGIPFRQNQMVAAHRAYPFGTLLRVTNLRNDRSVNVRVVDRGPFARPRQAARPVIDLSRRAAQQLGFIEAGRAQVRIEVLEWGDGVPQVS
jgi:rare lipoprotein A